MPPRGWMALHDLFNRHPDRKAFLADLSGYGLFFLEFGADDEPHQNIFPSKKANSTKAAPKMPPIIIPNQNAFAIAC
jgi:hypothetical protein